MSFRLFALTVLLLLAFQTRAAELLIETQLADDGGLLVTYTPPQGISELRRMRDSSATNLFWKQHVRALDDCSQVSGLRIVLRADPSCKSARLRVEPALLDMKAEYEAALPMKDQGVLSYTNYFLVAVEGHGLRWRWTAPANGNVLHQGRLHTDSVDQAIDQDAVALALREIHTPQAWERLGGQQYVYLGRAPAVNIPGGVLVHDKLLDESRLNVIKEMLNAAMQGLGSAYRRWPAGPVGVVVTTSDSRGFRGDVTQGRMMSLRLPRSNHDKQSPTQIQHFLAHEVTHWWNSGVFSSDSKQPWLHEGHAEWTALLLMRSLNLWSQETAIAQLEDSLNRCVAQRGEKAAATMNTAFGHGDDPYACGLALLFVAQTMHDQRLQPGHTPSVVARLATLHQHGRELSVPDFAAWADGDSPGLMSKLLLDPGQAFEAGFVELLQVQGLARVQRVQDLAVLPAPMALNVASSLMKTLMASDCGGAIGFWTLSDAFRLDDRLTCQSLRLGGDVVAINTIPLTAQAATAWRALAKVCAVPRPSPAPTLSVHYRSGPPTIMDCPATLPAMPSGNVISLNRTVWERYGY